MKRFEALTSKILESRTIILRILFLVCLIIGAVLAAMGIFFIIVMPIVFGNNLIAKVAILIVSMFGGSVISLIGVLLIDYAQNYIKNRIEHK